MTSSLQEKSAARITLFQQKIREEKLAAFLVVTVVNRSYITGFAGTQGVCLVTPRGAQLFVDGRYTERAQRESAVPVRDKTQLGAALQRLRGRAVGVEDTLTIRAFQDFKRHYRGVRWRVTSGLVEALRVVKRGDELRHIRQGSHLIDQAFRYAQKIIRSRRASGLTEIELAAGIERFGREHGASGVSFEPIVAWGKHSAIPHHASSTQKIGTNNFLLLDFGFTVNGYQSDFTRTLFIGRPTGRQREIYETVLTAQQRAITAALADAPSATVDAAARRYIAEQGFGEFFTHNTGHGVGLEIHEAPNFSAASKDRLVAGSVVTVEPGIYLSRTYGVRIEDMVLVGTKPKIFSAIDKNFAAMVINGN